MSAVRMDGKALSAKVRGSILAETEELKKQGVTPGLAVIIVGNDPASEIYVRNKERACEQCGFYSEKYALPEETTQEELLGLIAQLNESPAISGILCQMPVPKHISEQAVIDAIDPKKDVDAFHPVNVGKIMVGNFDFVPCTPAGVMELLDEYKIDPKGKECIVENKQFLYAWLAAVGEGIEKGWSKEECVERISFADRCLMDIGQPECMEYVQTNNVRKCYDYLMRKAEL